ncbi:hypothetical protein DFH07DRAFT_777317 [Mycena maculata]|uniref:Uncharacterized protein n=1 Tax=Mycena maculata TaxID=230809 RepID=A0AAD7II91_9AGAR|nr:hypothetical protein DFH07DRAFT_777317 [Mycena maculata]
MYRRSTVNTNYVNDQLRARHVGTSVSEPELAPELRKQARYCASQEWAGHGRGPSHYSPMVNAHCRLQWINLETVLKGLKQDATVLWCLLLADLREICYITT